MKRKHILSLLTILTLGLCYGQPDNRLDEQGRKQGAWEKYFENTTKVFYTGSFVDDKPVGLFTYFYKNGKVKGTMDHRGDGVVYNQTFHPNAQLMAQGKYIAQKKDSVWTYYTDKGILASREEWDRGAKHGLEEVYFENGIVSESTMHQDGLRNGPWLQFYENGKQKVVSTFVQDELDGPIQYYFDNGGKEVTGVYNKGVRTGTWMYFNQDGTVRYQAVYRGGKIQKERFENGTFDTYGGDNVVLSTTTYKNGLKEGEFVEYHDDAVFKLEQVMDPKTGEQSTQEVKTGNELKRKGTYVKDKLEGEVLYYNELGRMIKKENYKEGILQ